MSHLYLYTAFHANLNFSSIPRSQYSYIIDRCFWPVLEFLDVFPDLKLGLEFPAHTLELIQAEDTSFIQRLRELWENGRCEVLGAGYVQSILPLIPPKASAKNLEYGNQIYTRILGEKPSTAYVNEQTYSSGILSLYKAAGYSRIISDWDNSVEHKKYPDSYRYAPQWAKAQDGARLPIVWSSSVAFQKFQRYMYGEITLDEYLEYLYGHISPVEDRALSLYSNDWEVFDYKPGDHDGIYFKKADTPELDRMKELFAVLTADSRLQFVLPSEVEKLLPPQHEVSLESSEEPIVTKKQLRYNVTRWAVCGRDDAKSNTLCYRLYKKIGLAEALSIAQERPVKAEEMERLWNELAYLWASDFRTNTTDEKYIDFQSRMGHAMALADKYVSSLASHITVNNDFALFNPSSEPWCGQPFSFAAGFKPGQIVGQLKVALDGVSVPTQIEDVELYRDGSLCKATVVIKPQLDPLSVAQCQFVPQGNNRDFNLQLSKNIEGVITPSVTARFLPGRGGAIRDLVFPSLSSAPLAGTIFHGYFNSVKLSPDWYTGGVIITDRMGEKHTDLSKTELWAPQDQELYEVRIPVRCKVTMPVGTLWKTYYLYRDDPRVDCRYHFRLNDLRPLSFRLGMLTLNPGAFVREDLHYSTTNGGWEPETFPLVGKTVMHDEPVSVLVTSHGCLGATEGWVDISDRDKGIAVITDLSDMYSVPMMHYEETEGSYFCRVYTSLGEYDETAGTFWRGHNSIEVTYYGHGPDGQSAVKTEAAAKNNGLMVVWPQD